MAMSPHAERLLAETLRRVKGGETFLPAEIGRKIGLSEGESNLAARLLSNQGVFDVGFDGAARLTVEFRKLRIPDSVASASGKARRKPSTRKLAKA